MEANVPNPPPESDTTVTPPPAPVAPTPSATSGGSTPPPFERPPRSPMPPPPLRSQPPGGSSGRSWGWIVVSIILVALLLVSVLFNVGYFASSFLNVTGSRAAHARPRLTEVVLEDNNARAKIAVVDLDGMIMGSYIDSGDLSPVGLVGLQLKTAEEDSHVKAVLLRINSPGGEVLASDEIARALREFQQRSGKPVVVSMGGLAASGGYYVAAPCRWIVANELTITGSIGVIMQGYNYRGLMDKVGVRPEVFKSGKFKDMMRGSKADAEVTPEERKIIQTMIDQAYGRFKTVVAEGRAGAAKANKDTGRKLVGDWTEYADGRILTGQQAYDLGFADELGYFDTAVARTKKIAGIERANLVQYQPPLEFFSLLRLLGQSDTKSVKLDLGFDLPKLKAGYPYFLFLPGLN